MASSTSVLDVESDLESSKRRLSRSRSGSPNDPSPKSSKCVCLSVNASGDIADSLSLHVNADCVLADCVLTECRPRDLFELGVRVQLSQGSDVKPDITMPGVCGDVNPLSAVNLVPSGGSDCPSIAVGVLVLDVSIEAVCEDLLLDGLDVHSSPIVPNIGEVHLEDYSLFPDDIVDLCFVDVQSDGLGDVFIPTMDDIDECLFTNESLILPTVSTDKSASASRFGTVTTVEMENVRRGGERRSEASERWAARCFDDWRKFRGHSIAKSIGELSEQADLCPFMDMLTKFILEIRKRDGALYHATRYVYLFLFLLLSLFSIS
jgi:hypothetical protein